MKSLKINITVFTLLFGIVIHAQQMQQKIEMRLDSIGNTKIKISGTMNALQWQNWIATFGNNPAALKREFKRAMPKYILDDFKLEKDDMNRSFNLTVNAYGVCTINKKGDWLFETDQKNAQLTKLSDYKYMLVNSPPEFGGTIQQTFVVEFPETAKSIKTETDAFGETIFEFKMDNPSSGMNLMVWAGFLFIAVGGGWTAKELLTSKKLT